MVIRHYPTYAREGVNIDSVRESADYLLNMVEPMLRRAESLTWCGCCRGMLKLSGREIPQNDRDVIRAAVSSLEISEALSGLVGSAVLRGAAAQTAPVDGLVRVLDIPDFLQRTHYRVSGGGRLEKLPRGGEAEHAEFGLSGETHKNSRYAVQVILGDEDLADGATIGLELVAFEELGRAAARTWQDLVVAYLLRNGTMADGQALFSAAHDNVGTAVLGATGLHAAMAAIAGQTQTDGEGNAVHLNATPKLLLVAPALLGTARALAYGMNLGDDADIEVRADSRLGPAGVVDPDSGEVYTGSNTTWLLTARAQECPSIIVGCPGASLQPQVRRWDLDQGQWGLGFDVKLDCGVSAADYAGLYYSSGTG